MKKELEQKIQIPEGVEVKLEDGILNVKGPQGESSREIKKGKIDLEIKDGHIILGHKKATKKEKKIMNTLASHIKNMVKGVQDKFEYKLKVCSSHFPMTVELKDNEATIKNFLGGKISKKVKILPDADVKIDKDIITITSSNKEVAGQTAANFEKSTRISNKDRRVFQDGIFITSKAGKEI